MIGLRDLQVALRHLNSGSGFNGYSHSSVGMGAVRLMFGTWLVLCACLASLIRVSSMGVSGYVHALSGICIAHTFMC